MIQRVDIWNTTNFLLEDPNGSRTKERGTQLWNHNGRKSVYPLELACTFIYMGSEKCSPNNNFFFQLQLTVNLIYYLSNTKNIEVNVADKHFFLEIQYNKFKNPELTLSQMITHGSWTLMTFLSKSVTSLNIVNISWAMSMRHCFCSKFSNFGTIFAAARFMPKTSVKIAWHEPNDMPTSSATSLVVIRRLSKIIFFTASMFSLVVDVLERPGQASSLKSSRCSLNRLYHNWTYVLLIVDSQNTVDISSVLAHLI